MPVNIQCVSHLILENPIRWDSDLITTHFSERDATAILELPLTQSLQGDTLFWQPDSKGYFTVKSTYKLAWNNYIKAKIQAQEPGYEHYGSLQNMGLWWVLLWKLNIMPRSKVFVWRLCRKALPTKDRLQSKLRSYN